MYYPKLDIQRFIAQTSNKQGLIIFQPDTKDRSETRAIGDHRVARSFCLSTLNMYLLKYTGYNSLISTNSIGSILLAQNRL